MAAESEQISAGFEKDRLGGAPGSLDVRWWFFMQVPGEKLRNQQARLGVEDNGFTFARGGRAASEEEAQELMETAWADARVEIEYWRGQPSHALGKNGELIPLTQLPELPT